jgi:peptidoglycan/xylan/chitin deacetylase (PgdA/CDA1 family)
MYHYVRDLPRTPYPRIKALLTDTFWRQVTALAQRYEIATLESALDYLQGAYEPDRDLCLLTFDDGLNDHFTTVMPILSDLGLPAVFFVSTACIDGRVAAVHQNHFVMAALGEERYCQAVLDRLAELRPGMSTAVPPETAQAFYRWDSPAVASVKYLINVYLPLSLRDELIATLFIEHIGDMASFAEQLYLSWDQTRQMQAAGMTIGGHAHDHVALAVIGAEGARHEATTCYRRLREELRPQHLWSFSYPYGSYDPSARCEVQRAGFGCSFTVESGENDAGQDLFAIRRIDANEALSS